VYRLMMLGCCRVRCGVCCLSVCLSVCVRVCVCVCCVYVCLVCVVHCVRVRCVHMCARLCVDVSSRRCRGDCDGVGRQAQARPSGGRAYSRVQGAVTVIRRSCLPAFRSVTVGCIAGGGGRGR
jgi:hypothetical protein